MTYLINPIQKLEIENPQQYADAVSVICHPLPYEPIVWPPDPHYMPT